MSTLDQHRLGAVLKSKRYELELGLREVAAATDISASTLSRVENGKGRQLQIDTFLKLCDWLEVDPTSFIISGKDRGSAPHLSSLHDIEMRLRACPEVPELCKAIAHTFRLIRERSSV